MRDDIHKSAPVSTAWRRVIKHCTRAADRDSRAIESANRAILEDCSREISPQFVTNLIHRCDDPQAALFGSKLDGVDSPADLGGDGHVLEQQILKHTRRLEHSCSLNRNIAVQAISHALQERNDAQGRAIRGHILKQRGKGVPECVQAVNKALVSVSVKNIAEQLVASGGKLERAKPTKSEVGLDENLLGGRP